MIWTIMPYYLRALNAMRRPFRGEKGQGLVEYALILVLVALVVIVALILLGDRVSGVFGNINDQLDPAAIAATATKILEPD